MKRATHLLFSSTILALLLALLPAPQPLFAQEAPLPSVPPVGAAESSAVTAQTLTFVPVADSYVSQIFGQSGVNYGSATRLEVSPFVFFDGGGTLRRDALLNFDVLSRIPAGSVVNSAELRLRQTVAISESANLFISQITEAWSEDAVTFDTRPSTVDWDTGWAPDIAANIVITRDLTALVDFWVRYPDSFPDYGILLRSTTRFGEARTFGSRESAAPPELVVNYTLPAIRLCWDDAPDCGHPADKSAELRNVTTGAALTIDGSGYVANIDRVRLGDRLWGRYLVSSSGAAHIYATTGLPVVAGIQAFPWRNATEAYEMHIYLSRSQPVLVRDMTVSAQWNLEPNDALKKYLSEMLTNGSYNFYDYTDGQFVLGEITVYQNYENWPNADIWLHANNNFRPLSYIKGEVAATTADPVAPGVQYYPGQVYLGTYWNRYGLPAGQPTPAGVDVSQDFARAFGHELGHYLLGQFDSYLRVTGDGPGGAVVQQTHNCTGSAMGWVYDDANTEFVANLDHWNANCHNTLGDYNVHRTEWATIRTWYPWAQEPSANRPDVSAVPYPFTTVTFVAPAGAPEPLAEQNFTLLYQSGQAASPEARGFLFRPDGMVIDQGRPAAGVAPVTLALNGAGAGDRLCVIDINDNAEAPEMPRHQYGCEELAGDDNEMQMERSDAWKPVIEITPLETKVVQIKVTQALPPGTQLVARLYPEHLANPTAVIPLQAVGDSVYVGNFDLPVFTASAFVELWVDETESETNPRRTAIIDYGVGGGAVPGPKSGIGFAPQVSSSDGRAFFVLPVGLELLAEQFIALQSMAGTPPLPIGNATIGQAYRLISLPPSLVTDGSINVYFTNIFPTVAGAEGIEAAGADASQSSAALWHWDGAAWTRLATTILAQPNGKLLASAPSRGVGVYALLYPAPQIFMPLMSK